MYSSAPYVRSRRYVFRVDGAEVPSRRELVRPVAHVVEVPWLEADCEGFVLEEREPRWICAIVDDEARAEHTERAGGPEYCRRLRKAQVRVEPVERVEADDCVEQLVSRVPVLERRRHDLDLGVRRELPPRNVGEVRTQLDGEDRASALGKGQRGLARAAADLEQVRSRRQASQLDQVVEDPRWRDGACGVVPVCPCVERRAEKMPVGVFGHASCRITGVACRRDADHPRGHDVLHLRRARRSRGRHRAASSPTTRGISPSSGSRSKGACRCCSRRTRSSTTRPRSSCATRRRRRCRRTRSRSPARASSATRCRTGSRS